MSELLPLETFPFIPPAVPNAFMGKRGTLKWIPLEQLFIDPKYQRRVLDRGKANVKRIVERFSWALFAPLVVAVRGDNRYAVIDGQHRAIAALMHGGITSLPALILDCSLADEARAFNAINNDVVRPHALQLFRARLAAGNEAARELVEAVASVGVSIAPYPKTDLKSGETLALVALQRAFAKYGANKLCYGLKALMEDGGNGLPAIAITGVCEAMTGHHDMKARSAALGRAVKAKGLDWLIKEAVQRKGVRGGTVTAAFAAVLGHVAGAAAVAGNDTAQLKRMMAGR